MTKQEEIYKGVSEIVEWAVEVGKDRRAIKDIFEYLHSQGVVIKVDRELPIWELGSISNEVEYAIYKAAQQDMLKAGYVAVEPLVEKVR